MTLNIQSIKQNALTAFALGALLTLGACSSNPSPWTQKSSPWGDRQAAEPAPEPAEYVEPVVQSFEPVEPVEPVGGMAMQAEAAVEDPAMAESAAMAEPMAESEAEPVEMAMADAHAAAEPEPMPEAAAGGIASQSANHYAVQVVASSSMANLKNFAQQHQLSDQWTAETIVDGKTWYVLLLGVYPTMTEAKDALASIQDQLDTSPWVRSIGSLHAVMQ